MSGAGQRTSETRGSINLVIGSGPTGIAAAAALLEKGEEVTMLDAGGTLEPDVRSRVERLSSTLPEKWNPEDVERLRGRIRRNREGAPLKLAFGSDYPYRDVDSLLPMDAEGVDVYRGFAEGGLSVLWGASVLPYTESDLQGWPIRVANLRPHYKDVLRMTGLSAARDSLEAQYPLLIDPTTNLPASSQALRMLERMTANARELASQGVFFGKARLAVGAARGAASECTRCGLCLYGCPYGIIYSAQASLEKLLTASSKLRYLPGFVAKKIIEKGDRVLVEAASRDGPGPAVFEASRVYVAAGVYSSTAILLDSLGAQHRPVTLRQSDHFLLPLLLRERARGVAEERLHTMSQIFIEIMDRRICRHSVHLQIYTYNDFYSRIAQSRLGPLFPVVRPVLDRVVERLVLVKGYLHSEDSSAIQATLEPRGDAPVLRLRPLLNREAGRKVRSVVELLKRHSNAIGASPLRLGLRLGAPGSGAHVGGSFPMRVSPGEFETDRLGRPFSLQRVYVVDATVFPTIPAPTITLTAMANAHRIASESLHCETRS